MSNLFEVTKGKKKEPFNILLFSQPGLGKTTFASQAPNPIVIGGEETGEIDVARLPQPKTISDFINQVDYLIKEKGMGFKTLVIDTLDSVETLVHKALLESDPKQTGSMIAAHGGYAKALEMSANELLKIRDKFKILRDQYGMNVILLAHSKRVQITDTVRGIVYDSFELNLHQKAQAIFIDWVSAVMFADYVIHQQTGTNTDKTFAMGDGERVLLTEKRPGHLAKNRFNLPYELPLNFNEFYSRYEDFFKEGLNATGIKSTIASLTTNLDDKKLVEKIMSQTEAAGDDVTKLAKIEARVREIIK